MNDQLQDKRLAAARTQRQQKLDFARSNRWQQLPLAAQQACRQSLARLLCQVISKTNQEHDNEREDSNATS
jgi:hypothetical protein